MDAYNSIFTVSSAWHAFSPAVPRGVFGLREGFSRFGRLANIFLSAALFFWHWEWKTQIGVCCETQILESVFGAVLRSTGLDCWVQFWAQSRAPFFGPHFRSPILGPSFGFVFGTQFFVNFWVQFLTTNTNFGGQFLEPNLGPFLGSRIWILLYF